MQTLNEADDSSTKREVSAERPAASLRMVLVNDDVDRAAFVTQALRSSGHDVIARLSTDDDLLSAVRRLCPDVILVDMDHPVRGVLDRCAAVTQQAPRPIIFFACDADPDTISHAVRAGVSAYVVDGMAPHRINSILKVAISRFREHQKLRGELDDMRTRLADRRDVERAKSMLARVRRLDEAQAYALLRRSAMTRRITIGAAARTVLDAAELFDAGGADAGEETP